MQHSDIATIILAAGTSSRFTKGNKLLQPLGGQSILETVVGVATASVASNIVVVTGFDNDRVQQMLSLRNIRFVFNSQFDQGMGTSIAVGVRAVPDADGYAIWPADMPFVSKKSIAAVFQNAHPDRIIVPTYAGRRGHPVLFGRRFRSDLMKLNRDVGARELHNRYPDAVIEVPVDDPGIHRDIDTAADVETGQSDETHRTVKSHGARR